MKLKINIRQIVAGFLLLVFLLGATPKRFLHDAITQHEHTKVYVEKCSHHHINIGAVGFNCQLESLVVELPFEITIEPTFLFLEKHYSYYNNNLHQQETATILLNVSPRAPPVC